MLCKSHSLHECSAHQKQAGFTLVELLVVLAIVGLLATMATPQVLRYLGSAKVSTTTTQIRNLQSALELYYLDNGAYPNEAQGLNALIQNPGDVVTWNGPYLKGTSSVQDAWGNAFGYSIAAEGGQATIVSLGSDGKEGGEGPAADIRR